jgi:hypothetical protein
VGGGGVVKKSRKGPLAWLSLLLSLCLCFVDRKWTRYRLWLLNVDETMRLSALPVYLNF